MTPKSLPSPRLDWLCALLGVLCIAALGLTGPVLHTAEPPLLAVGPTVEASMAGGQTLNFRLLLVQGEFLRLGLDQRGIDIELKLLGPQGEVVAISDRPLESQGREWIESVATVSGVHTLVVYALPIRGPAGEVALRWEARQPATAADLEAARAFRLFSQGDGLLPLPPGSATDPLPFLSQALDLWRQLGHAQGQAQALGSRGRLLFEAQRHLPAENDLRSAMELFGQTGDRVGRNWAQNALAQVFLNTQRPDEAVVLYRQVLEATAAEEDRPRRLIALDGLTKASRNLGRLQDVQDYAEAALKLSRPDDGTVRANALHYLGLLYLWNLHRPEEALDYLRQARQAWLDVRAGEASGFRVQLYATLGQMGKAYQELGHREQARTAYQEALDLLPADSCRALPTLVKLALLEQEEDRPAVAQAYLDQARRILEEKGCSQQETSVWLAQGEVLSLQGSAAAAAKAFERCAGEFQRRGDPIGRATCQAGLARGLRDSGREAAAVKASAQALEVFERLRPELLREDLRTSFYADVQAIFDLHIDLLSRQGDHRGAFEASERARGQALKDQFRQARTAPGRGVAGPLLAEQQRLQERLNVVDLQRRQEEPASEAARHLGQEADSLMDRWQILRGEIRRQWPQGGQLLQPERPSSDRLQKALGENEAILAYRLSEPRSHLWLITREELRPFSLAGREHLSTLAREGRTLLRGPEAAAVRAPGLCQLSEALLGPALPYLGGHTLYVVADGPLEELPFAALPLVAPGVPCRDAPPLFTEHVLTGLPAATLLTDPPPPGPKPSSPRPRLAVFADPVYEPTDSRLPEAVRARAGQAASPLHRLKESGREARDLLALVLPAERLAYLGFDARRQVVLDGALHDAEILHFAVHGIHDPDQPLRSHLALSAFDGDGKPMISRLYAQELYGLELTAELVVLSACDTARGTWIAGEGTVSGLSRGFLFAGARRILASLWPVPDGAARRLMVPFYQGLLEEGLPPAEALQRAQRILWQEGAPPQTWAAFVLQGPFTPPAGRARTKGGFGKRPAPPN